MDTAPETRSRHPVVLVDDHELVGESLAAALRAWGLAARRMPVRSADQVVRDLARGRVGVVLLDLDLGTDDVGLPVDGVGLVEPLRGRGWRVLIVTGARDRTQVAAAVAAGALGVVLKSAPMPELVRAVVEALEGRQIMSATERRHWAELHRRARAARQRRESLLSRLTPREAEVLDLLARGMRVGAIAEKCVVAEGTVRTQVKSILRKLEVGSQLEAVALHRAATRR